MPALAERATRNALKGHAKPRLAPPTPARSLAKEYEAQAAEVGIDLMEWQRQDYRYMTALGRDNRWLYREVATIVSRQNGKTTLLIPVIVKRLREGRRLMHTAQDRTLPREVFEQVADIMGDKYPDEVAKAPRGLRIRFANGQEQIDMRNGGRYRIVAPTRSGARGPSNDDVIADELRELEDFDFIAASKPTLTVSKNPQYIYLSNMGEETSVVLNALRLRRDADPALAYLEWSAAEHRGAGDRRGWAESNPGLGTPQIGEALLTTLENEYRTAVLEGQLARFETEHLCRSVATTKDSLVEGIAWAGCEVPELRAPTRTYMAIAMAPEGNRASGVLAWAQDDGSIDMRMLFEVQGEPVIDTDKLGKEMRDLALKLGVQTVGFDPLTDAELAKYFKRTHKVAGPEFSNASARFVWAVKNQTLRWHDAAAVTDDLTWTVRKNHPESGSYQAVRAQEDRPITASLAAIRAVWLASGLQLLGIPEGF